MECYKRHTCINECRGCQDYQPRIGSTVKIYNPQLVYIAPTACIGEGTKIGNFTEVGDCVKIGKYCKIQAFVFIPKGVTISDKVFLGPKVCFTNDRYPSATDYGKFEETIVEEGVAIGAGSTIRCGITIGRGARIGAGSVVTRSVPPGVLVYGNPAREFVGNTPFPINNISVVESTDERIDR